MGGVKVLERDASNRVITDYSRHSRPESVTFSGPLPYIDQKNYLPTLRNNTQRETPRPTEVKAPSGQLKMVMANLPEPMAGLPKRLRWMLGREINQRLKRGWHPEHILGVLTAAMPAGVQRPYRLALWRLRHNVVGAGPLLRPLQQAWDAQAATTAGAEAEDIKARRFTEVAAVTSADVRAKALRAIEAKFRRPGRPVGCTRGGQTSGVGPVPGVALG